MKLQIKRAFENLYFCHPKNNKKTNNLCMKFSSTFNTSVQMCLYPLFQDRRRRFFRRMSQPSGQDQKNGEQTTLVLQNLLRGYIFSYLHGHLQRLICPEYFLNFTSNLYDHHGCGNGTIIFWSKIFIVHKLGKFKTFTCE